MKQAYLFLSALLMLLISSCSSNKEDEPIVKADYYGEFIDLTPLNVSSVETFSPKQAIELMLNNNVPCEQNVSELLINEAVAEQTTTTYSLSIEGDIANLQTQIVKGSQGIKTRYNVTSYKFTPGKYLLQSTDENDIFERFIVVSLEDVKIVVEYNGEPTENIVQILDFTYDNCIYKDKVELEKLETVFIPLEGGTSREEVLGKVTYLPDGNYTLSFSYATYTLNPKSGLFTQTSPEMKEIGILEKR